MAVNDIYRATYHLEITKAQTDPDCGQRVTGIYRRFLMLASECYAMLDEGLGFSLVPWKPVIEQRLGQQLAATIRGGGVSWEVGRQRGMSIS